MNEIHTIQVVIYHELDKEREIIDKEIKRQIKGKVVLFLILY
jgi:predicted nucleic acid-binding Zn ribbon protein